MALYFYTAVSHQKGEKTSGTENVQDEHALAALLRDRGYILTSAQLQGEKADQKKPSLFSFSFSRVSLTEKLLFVRNLKVMVSAGVALPKALDVLSQQVHSKLLKKTIEEVREQVMRGESLSESLSKYPAVFSNLMVSMIKVGEESGNVEGVLGQLSIQLEREHDLRSKITGALMYPAVIVVAMVGIGALMLMFVVPKLAETFEELGAELPLPTKVVIALGTFMLAKWYLAFGGTAIFTVALCKLSKTAPGKKAVGTLILHLPIISGIVRKMNAAFTVRTLSSLISAGVSLVQSLEITAGVLGNVRFKRALLISAEKVQKGTKLSLALAEHANVYPLTVVQMVEVGEETGQTSEVLAKLADFYEEEVTAVTKNLTSIIEPILMLIIGGVVGFFAISMIQPMYSMLSAF